MNKNISKKFLVGLLAFNILTTGVFSVQGNNNKITYAEEEKIVVPFVLMENGENGPMPIMTPNFSFEILKDGISIGTIESENSMLTLNLSNGSYTIKLKDEEYTMEDVQFNVVNGEISNYENINFILEKKQILKLKKLMLH